MAMGQQMAGAMGQAIAPAMGGNAGGAAGAAAGAAAAGAGQSPQDAMALIEKLGELKEKGILSEEEFSAKKAELLKRIV